MKIVLDLTEAQLNQLIHSLNNDWNDNSTTNQKVIERILKKIKENFNGLRHI